MYRGPYRLGRFSDILGRRVWLSALVVALSGCQSLTQRLHHEEPYALPAPKVGQQYAYAPDSGVDVAHRPWWEALHDPALEALCRLALQHNNDVVLAKERVALAQLGMAKVRAERLPQVYARGGYIDESTDYDNVTKRTGLPDKRGSQLGIEFLYDFDLFGVKRAQKQSAKYEHAASTLAVEAAQQTVLQELLSQYTLYQSLLLQQDILKTQLRYKQQQVELSGQRARTGYSTQSELLKKQIEALNQGVLLDDVEGALAQTHIQLSQLVGITPKDLNVTLNRDYFNAPLFKETLHGGQPLDLLMRRPDIQLAEMKLRAEHARLLGTQRSRLPQTAIKFVYGGQDLTLSPFGNPAALIQPHLEPVQFANLALTFAFPLFDKRIRAAIDAQSANERISLLDYEKTVFRSLLQVERALAERDLTQKKLLKLEQMEGKQGLIKQDVDALYASGQVSRIEQLEGSLTQLLLAQRVLQAKEQLAQSTIHLYASVGGGFSPQQDGVVGQGADLTHEMTNTVVSSESNQAVNTVSSPVKKQFYINVPQTAFSGVNKLKEASSVTNRRVPEADVRGDVQPIPIQRLTGDERVRYDSTWIQAKSDAAPVTTMPLPSQEPQYINLPRQATPRGR